MDEEKITRQEPYEVPDVDFDSLIEKAQAIYFVGIGGVGMSATAGITKQAGFSVFGTDQSEIYSPAKDVLDKFSIDYKTPYDAQNIVDHPADIYIASAGEDENNPEIKALRDSGKPIFSFSNLLAYLYRDQIRAVVAGTHGKSTTAGLLGYVLSEIDDSSFMTGAILQDLETNFHSGDGHYAVFEGDEYKALYDDPTPKFHYYKADILVLTNLEYDHPDLFESFEAQKEEFQHLVANIPADGLIIYNADDPEFKSLVYGREVAAFCYGMHNDADYYAHDISYGFKTTFTVDEKKSGKSFEYELSLPGEINVYNGLSVIATLRALNFDHELIKPLISEYQGVKRRFEVVGKKDGVTYVDDYAHHPTAVRETLEAAKLKYPGKRIWGIFEPHTFSRTQATLADLAKSFSAADKVLISDIYPARENIKNATITSQEVVDSIAQHHKDVRLVHNKSEAKQILRAELKPGDVVIVMAVGSFNRLAYELLDS